MITLKKVTEEGEQVIAVGSTYKQVLEQFLDGMEEDMLAVGIRYTLTPGDDIYEGDIDTLEAEEVELKQIGGEKHEE